jgi:N-methylhydantoinase B
VDVGKDGKDLRTMANDPIYPGEKYYTMCPGGGGYGNPLLRDVSRVQDDVMDGLISLERARDVYGVVLNPETFEVDGEATKKFRAGV